MNYASPEFLFVFIPTLAIFILARRYTIRFFLLLASSLIFYGWTGVHNLIFFAVVLATAWFATVLAEKNPARRDGYLFFGVGIMALHLFIWKYLGPIALAFGVTLKIPLPLGISFFTLQGIAYLIDYRRGDAPFLKFKEFFLFKSFFPQLIMGPIVRVSELLPQLRRLSHPSLNDLSMGLFLSALGLFKKLVLSDSLAPWVNAAFEHPSAQNGATLLLGTFAFMIQLFADFSGYTDMGRGAARMLGIRLPENFLSPFLAGSPAEFWRRWHVTFTTWIRDYIYVPLGGNRGTWLRQCFLVAGMMLLSALWHEGALHQVLFGLYHAALIIGYRSWRETILCERIKNLLGPARFRVVSVLVAQFFIFLGLIPFRIPSIGLLKQFCVNLFRPGSVPMDLSIATLVWAGVAFYGIHALGYYDLKTKRYVLLEKLMPRLRSSLSQIGWGAAAGAGIAGTIIAALYLRGGDDSLAFIYFQF